MKKPVPEFKTDEEAEKFVDSANLAHYDLSGGIPMAEWMKRYEKFRKDASINLRLPSGELEELRKASEETGIPVQRLIRRGIGLLLEKSRRNVAA